MASDYRLSGPLAARLAGFVLATLGVGVVLLTVLVVGLDLPSYALTVGLVLVVIGVLATCLLVLRRPQVVRLDDEGYRVRLIRGAGVRQARWKDVEDVVATTRAGERCVVLRLRDGRTTTVPVRVLAGPTDGFVADLQQHLNRGHGYRRIN